MTLDELIAHLISLRDSRCDAAGSPSHRPVSGTSTVLVDLGDDDYRDISPESIWVDPDGDLHL